MSAGILYSSAGATCSLRRPPFSEKKRQDESAEAEARSKPMALVAAALAEQELRLLGIRMPSKSKLKSALAHHHHQHLQSRSPSDTGEPSSCFGRALSDQPTSDVPGIGQVPSVLTACCDYLRAGHLEVEGLFRVEGSKVRVRDLRQRLERGCGIRDGTPTHDVCSTLKAWLRELPDPLVPARIAHALAEVSGQASLERRVRVLRLCGLLLASGQLRTLQYLCDFLGQVSCASPRNRMDAPNLATCLGPSLLHACRPPACPREVTRLNGAVALLIEFSAELGRWPADLLLHHHSQWQLPPQQPQPHHHHHQPPLAPCDRRRRSSGAIGGALKAVGRAVSRLASRSRSRSPGRQRARHHLQQPPPPPPQQLRPSPSPPAVRRLLHRLSAGSAARRVAAAPADDLLPPLAPRKLRADSAGLGLSTPPPPPPPLPPLSTLPSASVLRTPLHPHHLHHQLCLAAASNPSGSPVGAAAGPMRAIHHLPATMAAAAAAAAATAGSCCGTPVRGKAAAPQLVSLQVQ